MVRALCLQLGLGLGLGPGDGIICSFFFLCIKVTKSCVLLSWHVAVQRSDIRPTLRDVMVMYSQDRYMKDLPICQSMNECSSGKHLMHSCL